MALTNVMQAGSPITDVTSLAERLKEAREELTATSSQRICRLLVGIRPRRARQT